MTEILLFTPLDRLLWGVAITVLIVCGIYYLVQAKKKETREERIITYGFSMYFLCYAVVRIFFFLSEFFNIGRYVGHFYYGEPGMVYPLQNTFAQWAYIFGIIDLVCVFFVYEYSIKKTRFVLTGISLIILTIMFIVPYDLSKSMIYAYSMIGTIFLIFIIYSFTRHSGPEFQPVATFILFGYIIAMLGHSLDSSVIKELDIIPLELPPVLIIIGAFLYILPSFINLEKFQSTNLYSLGLLFLIGISLLISTFIIVNVGISNIISAIAVLGNVAFNIILIFFIRKMVKADHSQLYKTSEGTIVNILGSLAKPKKITEEEVSISKEKKICLVCKGKVLGLTFICTSCESFYCNKCYSALTGLENLCWACEAPFDDRKPVQKAKEDEKEVEIKQETHKVKEKD